MIKALIMYQAYKTRKDLIKLEGFKDALLEANNYIPNTYDYFLNKAIYCVLSNRDINNAKEHIKQCSDCKGEYTWRYSDAFLCAYEGRGAFTLYKKYKSAFRKSYPLIDIAWFIEDILEENPDRIHLMFALGMVYSEMGENDLAIESFNGFLSSYDGKEESAIKLLISERLDMSAEDITNEIA
jgi:hypothetical protein